MVMKACWILGAPSFKAEAKLWLVSEVKIVGKRVVLSLQICEIETADETLKLSSLTVLYTWNNSVTTSRLANEHPALID